MAKRILVICDYMPHILEFMEPAINEARRRGYDVVGAYFGAPARDGMAALGIIDLHLQGGAWDESGDMRTLRVPQAVPLLEKLKPSAVFIDIIGVGHAGGPWLEECYKRKITAIEFGGCRSRVYLYNKGTREVTGRYIEQLKAVGYGQHSDGLLAGTDAWQWAGLNVGDRLRQKVGKGAVRKQLGLKPGQKYVALMGNWGAAWGYANMAAADLIEWDEMARAHGLRLVYSPHPIHYYAKFPEHKIPEMTVLAANFPGGVMWGRKAQVVRTFDLVRAAEFLIYQYVNGTQSLAVAARIPMWLRRRSTGRADPAQFSRLPMEEGGIDHVQGAPRWPHINRLVELYNPNVRVESCYRTAWELGKLFRGELGYPGSVKDWARWDREFRLRLDGKTAERIVDLLG